MRRARPIVDDERSIRRCLSVLSVPYEVIQEDAPEALGIVKRPVDIVLMT